VWGARLASNSKHQTNDMLSNYPSHRKAPPGSRRLPASVHLLAPLGTKVSCCVVERCPTVRSENKMISGGAKRPGFQASPAKELDEDAWWSVFFLCHSNNCPSIPNNRGNITVISTYCVSPFRNSKICCFDALLAKAAQYVGKYEKLRIKFGQIDALACSS
jgi:hypothetical protein